jgi:uncharacterized protein YceK
MRKLLVLFLSICFICGCATVAENINMVKCRYELLDVQPVDFNISSISMNVVLGITNLNKKTAAAVKRFEGELYINETGVSKLTLKDVRVEAGQSKSVRTLLDVPISALGKTLTGLVTMSSASIVYEVKGTMYFDTPLGELPLPVTVYKDNLVRGN